MFQRIYTAAATLSLFGIFGLSPHLHAQRGDVLTWHNDTYRSGSITSEITLKHSNVNSKEFGKIGFYATDGVVDTQPLYVDDLNIGGKTRNVLFVGSENDTVYAFDAYDGKVLWTKSLLAPGDTPSDDHGCGQITPEIGVTSTPVIDLSKGPHGALYVVGMVKGSSGGYHQRIHALDLLSGEELFGGPTEITATYPGTGANSSGGNVVFDPAQYAERAGLLEWKGAIYTSWTSHCDKSPYTGWIISFDATTLKKKSVLNLTPNGSKGAIWMSGAGLVGTANKILFLDANGTFDTTLNSEGQPTSDDYGNAFISLTQTSSGKLAVEDYYATDNTVAQSGSDIDLGSGGALAFHTITDDSGNYHNLAVGAGKDTNIYLVNRDNMGKYNPNGGTIYQVLTGALPGGEWGAPAFFNNTLYYGGANDTVRAFRFSDAKLVTTPTSTSAVSFAYPGTTPSVSSDGTESGIVWAIMHSSSNPGVLYAFNAYDLSEELYDSNQEGTRDQFGIASHFITPTISHGHVYVGTKAGVAVFGLLNQ